MIGLVIVRAAVALPEILAIGVGLVLSVVFRQRLGNRSLFTLLGFAAMLVATILSLITTIIDASIPTLADHEHVGIGQLSAYLGFIGLFGALAGLAGWVLLLIGIFRKPGIGSAAAAPSAVQPPAPAPPVEPSDGPSPY